MPAASVAVVEVVFRALEALPLHVWSGVLAGKIVYDALSACGAGGSGGWFRVSPLYEPSGRLVWGSGRGVLEAGGVYFFRASFWGERGLEAARSFVSCSSRQELPVEVSEISGSIVDVELPEPRVEPGGEPRALYVCVEHLPAFYRFHGATVAYPSPERLVASLARMASMASGVDYRPLLEALRGRLELVEWRGRRTTVIISHGKRQPVFHGHACYYTVLPETLARALHRLLSLARATGVGGSPGLGLGWVEQVYTTNPPFDTPAPPLEPLYNLDSSADNAPSSKA